VPYRFASGPPGDRVFDLSLTDHYDGTYTLTWSYKNLGDYDQNGTVGISDITPLAIHYNEEVPEDDREQRASIQAVVDGSENGKVDIADITPIAMNYGTECAAYSIRSALSYPESIEDTLEIDTAPVALAEGEDRKTFSVEISEEPRTYIAVAPMDAAKTPGELSNMVLIPNHPPVAQLVAEPTEGEVPLQVSFDASGSSDIDGPIVKYEWDWEGDGVYDRDTGNISAIKHMYSSAKIYDPQVRVTDKHNGTGTAEATITVGMWRVFVAAHNSYGAYHTNLVVVNGHPAVSYYGHYDLPGPEEYIYVQANDPDGTTWGDQAVVQGVSQDDNSQADNSLAVANGHPAIAYCEGPGGKLWYARANDAGGSAWGTPIMLSDMKMDYNCLSMAIVNGHPAIAYKGRLPVPTGRVHYIRANDPNGETWGTPIRVNTMGSREISLLVVNGKPAICYENSARNLQYVRALDADGTAWGEPVSLPTGGEYILSNSSSMAIINGHPAVAYTSHETDTDYYDLHFVQATDAEGNTWGTPVVVDSDSGERVGEYCSLAEIHGRPAIAYLATSSPDAIELRYVEAKDLNGEVWRDPTVVEWVTKPGTTAQYCSLAFVNNHPAIAYCGDDVYYAIYY